MPHRLFRTINHNRRLLMIGTVLFAFYYVADCALDSLLFGEETFVDQLFNPSRHEIAIRLLSGTFMFVLFLFSAVLFNKNKSLHESIIKQSEELLLNNRELDVYNHALSHSLRNSLAQIFTAQEMLAEECGHCTDRDGNNLLEHIRTGCERMADQIEGMHDYSTSNRHKIEKERVALDEIAREIAQEMAAKTEDSVLDFQIDKNLETDCDPTLIRIALRNLIDNAVKFRNPDRPGEISFGADTVDDVPVYYIRDNGIGFDSAQGEQLGQPFTRLPEANAFPGSGVGLATANSIIEKHGGRLWSEGKAGDGATFYFTLNS